MSEESTAHQRKLPPYSLREKFWRVSLAGRTITDIRFDDRGICSVTLDDGELICHCVMLCMDSRG